MGLVEFVWSSFVSGVAYDTIKPIVGNTFNKLAGFSGSGDRDKFELVLESIIESNENIKKQLEALQSGKTVNLGANSVYSEGDIKVDGGSSVTGNVTNSKTTYKDSAKHIQTNEYKEEHHHYQETEKKKTNI